jgi:malate synthase
MSPSVKISGKMSEGFEKILSKEALDFVGSLHRQFNSKREELLQKRQQRQKELDGGQMFRFLPETENIRSGSWKVASTPADLQDRKVEITGPVERKMMINAFNSGASVFMADFEDALSPSWTNVVQGQLNLIDAVRRTLTFTSPEGKEYRLNKKIATLLVRPRGWHLPEKHALIDGQPISASLFDFGLYFFHNVRALLERQTGPYFYLPKLESHVETRLWNDVFNFAQDALSIPRGTIRATVLVETLPAAFEMEEILYELKDHSGGLNAGRWDYIFSLIKKMRSRKDLILPDRAQITMIVPFMRAYTELLIKTCHTRGAHALGGMAPFIPSRKNPEINEVALAKVREDKEREARDGFDGTWVAHPDLVPTAMEVFQRILGPKPHQKERLREEVKVTADQLQQLQVPGSKVTEAGFRSNVSVALQYLNSWLLGNGAAAIFNLMEDAATCEISRAQLWQWIHNGARLDDGQPTNAEFYRKIRDQELGKLGGIASGRYRESTEILDRLVTSVSFEEFLTIPAYQLLE